jgi:hypothetical protein
VGRLANETPTTRDEHEAGAAQTSRQAGRPASGRVGSGASLLPSCPRCPPTSEALHGLAREAAKAKATAKWWQMGMRSVHEALGKWGSTDLQLYTHDVHCTAAGAASSGGRGGASSAAACPSLGGRTPASFTTRPAARVRARPRGCWRGRRGVRAWPQVHPPRRRPRGTRGGRPVSGARRAGGYRLSRPYSG